MGTLQRHHAGLLENTATGRWHPIWFYEAPKPSEYGESHCRHHSKGNHVEGFATRDEALAWIATYPALLFSGFKWTWSGTGDPIMSPVLPVLGQGVAGQ